MSDRNTGLATFLLIGLAGLTGAALYRAFSPAERARRLRVAEAQDFVQKLRSCCKQNVMRAEKLLDRVKRGEVVPAEMQQRLTTCPIVGPSRGGEYDEAEAADDS